MFTDNSFEAVGFDSHPKAEKSLTKSSNVQTEIVVHESEEIQVVETKCVETQTSNEKSRQSVNIDYNSLAKFLKRVTPGVLDFLDEVHGSSAFDNYDLTSKSEPAVVVQLINRIDSLSQTDFVGKVSDVTWSTAGGTLAVSHSIINHETWCSDMTHILFYNLSNDNVLVSTPYKSLEVNSCVTSMMYHPEEPSIIASGLFNGDLLVWNLRDESTVSPLHVDTHGDFVSQIEWNLKVFNNTSALISSSNDGYICVYRFSVNFTQSKIHRQYKILKEKNPSEKTRPQSAGGKKERAAEPGLSITCFDFSCKDVSLFVVGTLCGGLYKCKLDSTNTIEGDESTFDPVIDDYDRHKGSVTSIKSAPRKNVFVTAGTDREIRIYDFHQAAPLQSISVDSTVIRLTWYYGHPDIFLAYGAGSEIKFFNLRTGRTLPETMLHSENRENATCLGFNPKREMVAIGNSHGIFEIWKIPRTLTP